MDGLDAIRVLNRSETIKMVGLSDRTWDRLEERGEGPLLTRSQQSPDRARDRGYCTI
jgi:hypothetical protein